MTWSLQLLFPKEQGTWIEDKEKHRVWGCEKSQDGFEDSY